MNYPHVDEHDRTTGSMIALPGGTFIMGSDRFYPEEQPARRVAVDAFSIQASPVTNRQFAAFVAATGHATYAEQAPDPADYPGMPPEMARAGSLLFQKPAGPFHPQDYRAWWSFSFDTDWRRPLGPGSSIEGLEDHPVVHVAFSDAEAYAEWAGLSLPTEAEWEYAARGGLDNADYAWGDSLAPDGRMLANYWQGQFPAHNSLLDGWERTSPVGQFPANGFGLYDMIGNVWEWTADWYTEKHASTKKAGNSCCIPRNPRGGDQAGSVDPCQPDIPIGRKVLKGGSHLCAENYCQRYRPAARYPQPVDTSTSHVGFRCVKRG